MLLQPKKIRYKKIKKGKLIQFNYKNNLNFGTVGLKSLNAGFISAHQIEAARQAINRRIRKKGKLWIKIFPNIPVTKKPTGIRMGKGKGNIDHWAAKIRGGDIIFEISGINLKLAFKALKTGGVKLSVKTQIFY